MKNLTNKTIKTLLAISVIAISLSSCVNREDDPTPMYDNQKTEMKKLNSIVATDTININITNTEPNSIGVDPNSAIDANAPILGGESSAMESTMDILRPYLDSTMYYHDAFIGIPGSTLKLNIDGTTHQTGSDGLSTVFSWTVDQNGQIVFTDNSGSFNVLVTSITVSDTSIVGTITTYNGFSLIDPSNSSNFINYVR